MRQQLFSLPDKTVAWRAAELPALEPYHVRVKTAFSYISAGTELRMMEANHENGRESTLGYSMSGTVTAVGADVSHVAVGDRVACIGAGAYHATEVQLAKNLVAPLPDNVPFEEAAPMAMCCFALEGLRKPQPELGSNILVVGAGLMGQITALLARRVAGTLALTDRNAARLALAAEAVPTYVADESVWKRLAEVFAPYGIEIVYFCSGGDISDTFARIRPLMVRGPDGVPHGKVSVPGGARLTVDLASASGNIAIFSSAKAGPGYRDPVHEAGLDYPSAYVRWSALRNVRFLLSEMSAGRFSIKPLITDVYPNAKAADAYEALRSPTTKALAVLLKY